MTWAIDALQPDELAATRGVLALCLRIDEDWTDMLRVRRHQDRAPDPLLISFEGRWVCPVGHNSIVT